MRRACVYANDGVLLNLYKRITSVLLMFCCFLCTPVIMSHYLHVALRKPVAFCGPVDCYTGAIILTVCVIFYKSSYVFHNVLYKISVLSMHVPLCRHNAVSSVGFKLT